MKAVVEELERQGKARRERAEDHYDVREIPLNALLVAEQFEYFDGFIGSNDMTGWRSVWIATRRSLSC